MNRDTLNVIAMIFSCLCRDRHYKTWTMDWTVDWTVDWAFLIEMSYLAILVSLLLGVCSSWEDQYTHKGGEISKRLQD